MSTGQTRNLLQLRNRGGQTTGTGGISKKLTLASNEGSPEISKRLATDVGGSSIRQRSIVPLSASSKSIKIRHASPFGGKNMSTLLSTKHSQQTIAKIPETTKVQSKMLQGLQRPKTGHSGSKKRNKLELKETIESPQINNLFNRQPSNMFNLASTKSSQGFSRPQTGINQMRNTLNRIQSVNPSLNAQMRPQTAIHQSVFNASQFGGQTLEYMSQSEMPIDIKLATAKKNLDLKSTISTFTRNENSKVDKTIEKIQYLEKQFEQIFDQFNRRKNSLANLDKIDCKDKIVKANREIKCLSYQISRLVQKPGESTNEIPLRKAFDIEVMQETLMTYRVHVKMQPSPAKFQVQYNNSTHGQDLKVYCSSNHKEPKENNCQKQYNNPTRFSIGSSSKGEFENEYIFLSFYSLMGSSITITVIFGEGKSGKSPNKRGLGLDDDDFDAKFDEEKKQRETDIFNKLMAKQRQKMTTIDFIHKNVEKIGEWNENKNEKVFRIRTTWQKIENAKTRKDMIEQEERKKKIFLLHRWEFIKEKRSEMQAEFLQLRSEQMRKFEYVRHTNLISILKHIYTIFDQKRDVVIRATKTQFAVNMFAIKFRLWSQKKRKTIEDRNQQVARGVMTIGSVMLNDLFQQRAQGLFLQFLQEFAMVNLLKDKLRKFHSNACLMQTCFRNHKQAQQLRLNHLSKLLFEKEKNTLMKLCMGKKVSKAKQLLLKKLTTIEDKVRDAVCQVYYKRCVTRFQARVLEWKLDYKMGRVADHVRERMLERIQKKKKLQEAIEKLLFLNVYLPDEESPAPVQPQQPVASPQKPKPAARGKKAEPVPVEPPKPQISPYEKIQRMLSYSGDPEEYINQQVPSFRFLPASRQVVQRLIIRACNAKSEKEFLAVL